MWHEPFRQGQDGLWQNFISLSAKRKVPDSDLGGVWRAPLGAECDGGSGIWSHEARHLEQTQERRLRFKNHRRNKAQKNGSLQVWCHYFRGVFSTQICPTGKRVLPATSSLAPLDWEDEGRVKFCMHTAQWDGPGAMNNVSLSSCHFYAPFR